MSEPLLIAVVGPTGSGKSDLGLCLAHRFGGEIVNFDSMQIYRGLDIGTAKLSPAQQGGITHHLIDIAEAGKPFSAGEFARIARRSLVDIRDRGRLPILVGGTGFYLRALIDGLFDGPPRSDSFRNRTSRLVQRGGLHRLYSWLKKIDPVAAGRIQPADVPRIVRALEVFWLTGLPLTLHFERDRDRLQGFRFLKLGLSPPRPELYQRIDRRVERMLADGWVAEVEHLLSTGISPEAHAFTALGYARIVQVLQGDLPAADLATSIQTDTRRYAKRQWTWFRKDKEILWFCGFGDDPAVVQQAAAAVENAL